MIDLSIVIVTWNTRDLLLECLSSLESAILAVEQESEETVHIEVIVVDNGSRDGTMAAVRAGFPFVREVVLPRNRGFSTGSNAGVRVARGRYLLLLNSDAVVFDDTIPVCLDYLDRHPDVGILGPQLLNSDGTKQNSFHNFPLVLTELLPKGILQFLFRRRFPSRRWIGTEPCEVEAVAGAAIFTRASVFARVGSLCEDYFFFLEETDWCWRVRAAGLRVVHLPKVCVVHHQGASSKRKEPVLTRIEYHRSLYRFFRTYRGMTATALVFLIRAAKALFYLVSKAPAAIFGAEYRARWRMHRSVLIWHLRGCPRAVGLAELGSISSEAFAEEERFSSTHFPDFDSKSEAHAD